MVWAQVASAVAPSIVNKVLGGSKGPSHKSQWNTFKESLKQEDMATESRLKTAKRLGIHPLVALGMPSNAGSLTGTVGNSGSNRNEIVEGLSNAGQNISRAIATSQSSDQRKFERVMMDQQLQRGELENQLLASQIASQRAQLPPAMASHVPGSMTGVKTALADLPTPLGFKDGVLPLHLTAYDEHGNPIRVRNPDLGDSEVLDALHAVGYTIPDVVHGRVTKPAASRLSKFFRSFKGRSPRPRMKRFR